MQYRVAIGDLRREFDNFQTAFEYFFMVMKRLFRDKPLSMPDFLTNYYIECILRGETFKMSFIGAATVARAVGLLSENSDEILRPIESVDEIVVGLMIFELVLMTNDHICLAETSRITN